MYRNHFSRSDENRSNSIEKAYRTYLSTYINEIDTLQTDLEASQVKMAPRETEDNAYAKFWGDKQRTLWYVMVFLEWSIGNGIELN